MKKFILYIMEGCPYVETVQNFAEQFGIEFETRDIGDPAISEELVERGGKRQVPYLVDVENAVEMYESEDIIGYLQAQ